MDNIMGVSEMFLLKSVDILNLRKLYMASYTGLCLFLNKRDGAFKQNTYSTLVVCISLIIIDWK